MIVAQINIESSVGVLCKTFEPPLSRSVHFSANSLRWLWPFVTSTRGKIFVNKLFYAFNESEFHPVVIFMKKHDYHWFSWMYDKFFRGQEVTCDGKWFGQSEEFKGNGLMTDISLRYFLVSFKLFSIKSFSFEILQKNIGCKQKCIKTVIHVYICTDINKNASVIFQWRHGLFSIQMITKWSFPIQEFETGKALDLTP